MTDTTGWLLALLIALPLIALAVYDLDVARELRHADRLPPPVEFLRLTKGIVYAVSGAAIIFAVLAMQSAVFLLTGIRLLPAPLPLIAIYVGGILASLAVYRLRSWIRGQP